MATKAEFRYFKTYETESNTVINYMCRQSKCKWRLVIGNNSLSVRIEKTDADHDHVTRCVRGNLVSRILHLQLTMD